MPSQSVLVIGGGLAGLSSAVALAEAGWRVRLLEKRPHLGGRATSYTLPDGGEIDNCQHVTLGCCTNLADFYGRVGAAGKIRFYDRLYFADKQGRVSTIEASPLPPPLHMAPSFLLFGSLTLADKLAIGNALLTIARAGGAPDDIDDLSMLEWLEGRRQTPAAIARFWRVVLVSALDEELSKTAARYGIEVFWKGFLSSREGYRVGIPSVPLAKLYDGCRETIERQGGEVRLRCGVRQILTDGNRFVAAQLEDGTEVTADACVFAVPHDVVAALLPSELDGRGALAEDLDHIKVSPITGVHLWFDRTVMTEPFLTLLDHTTQWVFNKTALLGENGSALLGENKSALCGDGATNSGGSRPTEGAAGEQRDGLTGCQYLQLVISASYDLVPKSRQEIIALCLRELAEALPATREARLVKGTVVKEVSATFSPERGVDRWRPGADGSGIDNLFLAGDWTRTGWPATMEGAVRSGYLAAESLLSDFGQPRTFLRPDLLPEGLCKIWAQRRISRAAHRGETSLPQQASSRPKKETIRA